MSFHDLREHYNEVDSTMAVARQRAQEGAPSGTAIIANAQSKGRGRCDRTWFSAPNKNLYTTVILHPTPRPDGCAITTAGIVVGVAACLAAQQLGASQAMIKWPNDIIVNESKLCGILTECEDLHSATPTVLVGFGFNVASAINLSLSDEIKNLYIGLHDITGKTDVSVNDVFRVVIDSVEKWYNAWLHDGIAPILNTWQQLDALYGCEIKAEPVAGSIIAGKADGISKSGALRVITQYGIKEIIAGDVRRVHK
ncbi:MAG: biotin--[acetyl-CoA-carboxylase] ligase [Deltaproteobacteria bacterium]|nr:biotin--[acetyl-CoA-carboxylase] ligase [Deltaproteobacteria bacterium]